MDKINMTHDEQDIQPPLIPPEVVEYLEQVFPDALPRDLTISDRELGASVGAQRVLDHLRLLVDDQVQRQME